MKKLFSFFTVLLFVCVQPLSAFAAEAAISEVPNNPQAAASVAPGGVSGTAPFEIFDGALIADEHQSAEEDTETAGNPFSVDPDELERVYQEIVARSETDGNILAVRAWPEHSLIFVEIAESQEKEYAKLFVEEYGSFVTVTNDVDAAITMEDGAGYDPGADNPYLTDATYGIGGTRDTFPWVWLWLLAAALLIGGVFVLLARRNRILAVQSANGNVLLRHAALVSRQSVLSAVKLSETAPESQVFNAILERIDRNGK